MEVASSPPSSPLPTTDYFCPHQRSHLAHPKRKPGHLFEATPRLSTDKPISILPNRNNDGECELGKKFLSRALSLPRLTSRDTARLDRGSTWTSLLRQSRSSMPSQMDAPDSRSSTFDLKRIRPSLSLRRAKSRPSRVYSPHLIIQVVPVDELVATSLTVTPPLSPDTPSSSASLSFQSTPNPVSPSYTFQRSIAKLTRTLGENIPPELVSHHGSPPPFIESPYVVTSPDTSGSIVSGMEGDWNRPNMEEVRAELRSLKSLKSKFR